MRWAMVMVSADAPSQSIFKRFDGSVQALCLEATTRKAASVGYLRR
jgi:hypothetical protein